MTYTPAWIAVGKTLVSVLENMGLSESKWIIRK